MDKTLAPGEERPCTFSLTKFYDGELVNWLQEVYLTESVYVIVSWRNAYHRYEWDMLKLAGELNYIGSHMSHEHLKDSSCPLLQFNFRNGTVWVTRLR